MTETKKWVERSKAEDVAHEKRQEDERRDAWFNHPSYWREIEELEASQRATEPVETLESAPYGNEHHAPSRPLARWEQRRGLKQAEEWTR